MVPELWKQTTKMVSVSARVPLISFSRDARHCEESGLLWPTPLLQGRDSVCVCVKYTLSPPSKQDKLKAKGGPEVYAERTKLPVKVGLLR